MKMAFLVQSLGYWGRGATVKEAAKQCHKAGASSKGDAVVHLIIGDDKPEISSDGMDILLQKGSKIILIGHFFSLNTLLKLKDAPHDNSKSV